MHAENNRNSTTRQVRFSGASWLIALCLLGFAGCGNDALPATEDANASNTDSLGDLAVTDTPGDVTATVDPLIGTWSYSGHVPAIVTITLTLQADKTFTFSETVAPPTHPAGWVPTTCVTTHSLYGTYALTAPGGTPTVTWTFAGGLANTVTGCEDPASDTPGTPMTPEAIVAYRAQGLFPPVTEAYAVTATSLVFTEPGTGYQKAFTK